MSPIFFDSKEVRSSDERENDHLVSLKNLIEKAKNINSDSFKIWGSGKPLREFLHVDDLSSAIKFIINNDVDDNILNIGLSLIHI